MFIFDAARKIPMESGRSVASINKGGCEMRRATQEHTRNRLWGTLTLLLVGLAAVTAVAAEDEEDLKWWNPPELALSVIVPWGNDIALQDDGGFALTLQMSAWESKILGIGVESWPPTLPGAGPAGYLVFEDPDGCPSFIDQGFQSGAYVSFYCTGTGSEWPDCEPPDWAPLLTYDCPDDAPAGYDWWADAALMAPWVFDETWVEFNSGVSVPAWVPVEERETLPQVWQHSAVCDTNTPPNCTSELELVGVGPYIGSELDSTRYGRWDRMPGLVVLSDHGPGLITQVLDPADPPYDPTDPSNPTFSQFFDPPQPLVAWNLAGHFSTVGHTLQADRNAWPGWGRTTLTAQLIAPAELFKPVILIDREITIPFTDDLGVTCGEGHSAYRLDGGPLTCVPHSTNWLDQYTNAELVTLRIFVVNGDAPDKIEDMDGNGVLNLRDVEAMGYKALTREKVVRFYQLSQGYCGVSYDFDGDHQSGSCVFGARAGGITGVPR